MFIWLILSLLLGTPIALQSDKEILRPLLDSNPLQDVAVESPVATHSHLSEPAHPLENSNSVNPTLAGHVEMTGIVIDNGGHVEHFSNSEIQPWMPEEDHVPAEDRSNPEGTVEKFQIQTPLAADKENKLEHFEDRCGLPLGCIIAITSYAIFCLLCFTLPFILF